MGTRMRAALYRFELWWFQQEYSFVQNGQVSSVWWDSLLATTCQNEAVAVAAVAVAAVATVAVAAVAAVAVADVAVAIDIFRGSCFQSSLADTWLTVLRQLQISFAKGNNVKQVVGMA